MKILLRGSSGYLGSVLAPMLAAVHNEAFNVGRNEENYRVSQLASIVAENMPGCRVEYAPGGSPDKRTNRADFSKIESRLPAYRPQWTVAAGVRQLCEAYQARGFTAADLDGSRYFRLKALRRAHGCRPIGCTTPLAAYGVNVRNLSSRDRAWPLYGEDRL
jgi:nucleoside-diphosphate-sugar epimerase